MAMRSPDKRARISLVFQQMMLVAAVPIGMALVICVALLLHLTAEHRHASVTKASVASRWIADRLRHTEGDEQEALINEAAKTLDARIGMFLSDGSPIRGTRFAEFSKDKMREVIASDKDFEKVGDYFVKAASVAGLEKATSVVVATKPGSLDTKTLTYVLVRLGIVAAVLLPIGFAFGFFFGTTINRRLFRIQQYLKAMTTEGAMRTQPMVVFDESTQGGDLVKLDMAASDLVERFKGELALYRDALDEVRIYDEQRTVFLETLGGELWAPLGVIMQESQRLIDGEAGELDPSQIEDMRIIQKGGERLSSLVQDMNDLSSVIADGIEHDEELVDLADVAKEVVRIGRWGIGEKEIELALEIDEDIPLKIKGNRQRIWQILTNLVANGVKFTEQGEVRVRLYKQEPGRVVMEVSDTGPGIPPGEHDDIFDPFTQHGDRKNRRRGTGLGLAICKQLTELHGGEIKVNSEKDAGTRFTVILPMES